MRTSKHRKQNVFLYSIFSQWFLVISAWKWLLLHWIVRKHTGISVFCKNSANINNETVQFMFFFRTSWKEKKRKEKRKLCFKWNGNNAVAPCHLLCVCVCLLFWNDWNSVQCLRLPCNCNIWLEKFIPPPQQQQQPHIFRCNRFCLN